MRAQQKISFTIVTKKGEQVTYMADDKTHLVLMVAALKKHHNGIRIIKNSIKLSKVLVIGNTIVAKAG